MLPGHADLTEE